MALWIILVVGWLLVLVLALTLFRVAGYTEKKVRGLRNRPRRSQQPAPNNVLPIISSQESSLPASHGEDEKAA
jgi:hypothetical protein